jgi:Cytochrome C oxidase, cbb3-type, subunit III
MFRLRFKLTLAATLSMLGIAADAQTLAGNIPFEFIVGKKVLPAGNYQFAPKPGTALTSGSSGTPWLSVTSDKQVVANLPIVTRLGGGSPDLRDATLVFDSFEGRRVLSEVWIPGAGGMLAHATPEGHSHEMVILQSGHSAGLSGQAVFERTCAKCHGPNGNGNEAANRFFQTPVPKLNSEYVQTKSDDELREIITQGRRMMDPVRVGQSTVQHLLPTESVGAVIAYVRTFKQQ